ncbi:RhoGAP domain containing protein [Entamoeba histolytica HM-1:IMSS-B]|uniref:RhoGAP domain containing protein n=6 Tax=Entamoeba histolytica TaxID=5759 RepID=C4LVB4_ENTH1|nr:RhoGAP domain containing protein [Entamoeba histolytica HM-1:IMSS]EMD42441.1 RhoGAP domain containing protein [Entamoeba histolytica KU27]EMH73147.1 RhoGAP domain containing protein [Entamoeba histolytica HM-1:IMSS-B]EMS16213.1 RhoGAP domain containing protein [Entamoeba histolytica HM-3:IMSS]ENY63210.1 RhoGAP domain containing protein [Entamoeba histolytica HM-1:IMSS-A]GAT92600.1 rhogap domain containing protein [Entamoeba histolytica]|eukprot:XP_653135.1 RhoGAP domain containing protein [Entamoeba histolytica HM-1:IMSS]
MNDWLLPAHKLCLERYGSNKFQAMEQLSINSNQITQTFKTLIPLIQNFHTKIENLRINVPKASSSTSIYHELLVISHTNEVLIEIFKIYENTLNKLSVSLKNNNSWGENISSIPDIAMQQNNMISNISLFQSLSSYINDLNLISHQMVKFNNIMEEEDSNELETAVVSVINERKKLLNTNYSQSTDEIIKNENEEVPLPILKAMYGIYFTPRSLEGVFRQCADSKALESYTKLIGVIDVQATDVVNLSGVIRKFLRSLNTPIWPQRLLQPMLSITMSNSTNEEVWVDKIRELTCQLPKTNASILKHLLALCGRITNCPESKMDNYNIAVCLGLSTFVSKNDIQTIGPQTGYIIKTFELMIKNKEVIFTDIDDCFKRRVNDVITPPIYHDIFFNKRQSMYFTRHRPNQNETKTRIFNIGKYVAKSTPLN